MVNFGWRFFWRSHVFRGEPDSPVVGTANVWFSDYWRFVKASEIRLARLTQRLCWSVSVRMQISVLQIELPDIYTGGASSPEVNSSAFPVVVVEMWRVIVVCQSRVWSGSILLFFPSEKSVGWWVHWLPFTPTSSPEVSSSTFPLVETQSEGITIWNLFF